MPPHLEIPHRKAEDRAALALAMAQAEVTAALAREADAARSSKSA